MDKEITTLAELATAINEKRSDELQSNLLTDLIIEKQVKVTTISNGNDAHLNTIWHTLIDLL